MAGLVSSKVALAIGLAAMSFAACSCQTKTTSKKNSPDVGLIPASAAAAFAVDVERANLDLNEIASSAHPFGSDRQKALTIWLKERAQEEGASVVLENFSAEVPNPAALDSSAPAALTLTKTGTNIYAFAGLNPQAECIVLIGSHYDTKVLSGTSYLGANDSASSSLALLQLLNGLKKFASSSDYVAPKCDIAMVWFDGEEALLPNWNDGLSHPAKIVDNTYGSRHAVSLYKDCDFNGATAKCLPINLTGKPIAALVLLDMIGSPDVVLVRELNSSPNLVDLAVRFAEELALPNLFETTPRAVEDDHIPFVRAGIPAIDLIDFHHLQFWHQAGDDPATISMKSVESCSKVGLGVALSVAYDPKIAGHQGLKN